MVTELEKGHWCPWCEIELTDTGDRTENGYPLLRCPSCGVQEHWHLTDGQFCWCEK